MKSHRMRPQQAKQWHERTALWDCRMWLPQRRRPADCNTFWFVLVANDIDRYEGREPVERSVDQARERVVRFWETVVRPALAVPA